jgi:hypothetical protein
MSNDPNQSTLRAAAFLPEAGVRGALERRRRGRPTNDTPADGQTELPRWSVPELIARAVPRPPTGGATH